MNNQIVKVPHLRFPEFNDNLITCLIGNVTQWYSGGTPSKDNERYWDGNIPWISAESMRGSYFSESNRKLSPEGLAEGSRLAKSGSILLLVRGSMLFNSIPVGIAQKDVAFNQDVKAIVSDQINHKYLLYYFQSNEAKLLSQVVSTGIGAGKLDTAELHAMPIVVPSQKEQEKIAAFFLEVDKRILMLHEKKKLFEQYKKGVIQVIFSRKIRFKDDNGKIYPDWDVKKLGDIATIQKGKGISKEDIATDGATKCILYGELYTKYQEVIKKIHSRTNLSPNTLIFSKANDVVLPASGESNIDIAKASCVTEDGVALGGDMSIIRSKCDGIFLAYYLSNAKKDTIAKLAQGNSVVHLYASQLSNLELEMPVVMEQKKIADFLIAVDEKIALTEKELVQAQKFKKALLQKMFI